MKRRRMRGARALVFVGAFALMAGVVPSAAVSPFPIYCRSSASVDVTPGEGTGRQKWKIVMFGACSGDFSGGYVVSGTMWGSSLDSGLCGSGLMRNLKLHGTLKFSNPSNPKLDRTIVEQWSASITTYPIVTPFSISGKIQETGVTASGAGVISTRIFGACGPGSYNGSVLFHIRTT